MNLADWFEHFLPVEANECRVDSVHAATAADYASEIRVALLHDQQELFFLFVVFTGNEKKSEYLANV